MLNKSVQLLEYILSKDGYEKFMEKASDIHYKIFVALAYFIVYVFFSSILSLIGGGWLNSYKAILINFLLLFHLTKPEILATVSATAPFMENETKDDKKISLIERIRLLSKNAVEAGKVYRNIICHLLLVASVSDLALSVIPIKNNPNIVAIIILCGMVMVYADVVWKWKTKTFEKATYWLVVIAVIINVVLLVPDPLYRYLFDWAPSDMSIEKIEKSGEKGFITNGIKSAYKAVNNAVDKAELEAEIAKLKAAADEAASKKAAEEAAKKAASMNNFPASSKHLIIPLQPGESMDVERLKKGDRFTYNRADGTFAQRNRRNGGTCWGVVDRLETISADYNGVLEIKNISNHPIEVHYFKL